MKKNQKKVVVANAFSLGMLPEGFFNFKFESIDSETARKALDGNACKSIIGHADTAKLFSKELGIELPMNRETFVFTDEVMTHWVLLVGQYVGPRLPEGATELPEGAKIRWWFVSPIDPWWIDRA